MLALAGTDVSAYRMCAGIGGTDVYRACVNPWGCVLVLAGTDVYRACVHTSGLCVGVGTDRRECVQSMCAHLGVFAGAGTDRRERVQSVCAHLGVCAGVGMGRRECVQGV